MVSFDQCATLSSRFSSLDQRTQCRILFHKWLKLGIPRQNDIAHDPRKHNTSPFIQMRVIPIRQVVLDRSSLTNGVYIVLWSDVEIGVLDLVGIGDGDSGIALFGEILYDFGAGKGSAGQRCEQDGCCACGLDFGGKLCKVGLVLFQSYARGLFLVVVSKLCAINTRFMLFPDYRPGTWIVT